MVCLDVELTVLHAEDECRPFVLSVGNGWSIGVLCVAKVDGVAHANCYAAAFPRKRRKLEPIVLEGVWALLGNIHI